ncbi:cyclic peptide export ABC transporter [Rapidithrix thailandica]|uniref:Cyclic peptide export ABC transporter n=1 Tax=Rapidithrix thailandica TaxID=413964 RepID=A0AAW9SGF4_9BACT
MNLLKGHTGKYISFVLLGIVAAVANTAIIYLINEVIAKYVEDTRSDTGVYLSYFAGAVALFFISRWLVSYGMVGFMQDLLFKIRLRVVEMVLKSPFHPLVKHKEKVYTALTRDTNNIVNASINMVDLLTNSILVVLCLVYMGILSWKLLLCFSLMLCFALVVYAISEKKAVGLFNQAMSKDDQFVRNLNELLSGFKEVIIARKKGADIRDQHMKPALQEAVVLNKKALVFHLNNRITGQMAFYIFIGSLLMFIGNQVSVERAQVISFVFVLLYIWSPIETIVLMMPSLSQAKISLNRLGSLQETLKDKDLGYNEAPQQMDFQSLEVESMVYQYQAEPGDLPFTVGPNQFELRQGDVVFIFGGNGSGKTTFINLLIGLFMADQGQIKVNEQAIVPEQFAEYRALFSPVFSDFHLFERAYGMNGFDRNKALEYLRLFELDHKVLIQENGFNTTQLSTGQRKRLALVTAMLEKKPILILDEFAADQDPYFRRKFYQEILPYLKQEGFTVAAITHDDNYYHLADKVYKMYEGKLEKVTLSASLNKSGIVEYL